jgi:hypothetical protein
MGKVSLVKESLPRMCKVQGSNSCAALKKTNQKKSLQGDYEIIASFSGIMKKTCKCKKKFGCQVPVAHAYHSRHIKSEIMSTTVPCQPRKKVGETLNQQKKQSGCTGTSLLSQLPQET